MKSTKKKPEVGIQVNCRLSAELIKALDKFVTDRWGTGIMGSRPLAIRSILTRTLINKGYLKVVKKESKDTEEIVE